MAITEFNPAPTNQNLTEDTLFTTYLNGTDNESGYNATLLYSSNEFQYKTNITAELFSVTTESGDPSYGKITFTPNNSQVGYYTILFTVSNGSGNPDTVEVTYQINAVNDAPIFAEIPNQTINEDETSRAILDEVVDLWVYASDEETADASLTFAVQSQVNASLTNCSINANQYINCSNPAANLSGYTEITVNVTDGNSWASTMFNITVSPVNDAPFFNSSEPVSNMTWPEDVVNNTLNLTDSFYDIDNSDLNYTYTEVNNITVSIDNDTGIVTFTPDGNFSGERYIRFRADDGSLLSDYSNNVTLNITAVNDPPILDIRVNFSEVIGVEAYYNFTDNVTEVEGDTIYFYSNHSIFSINETTGIINTSFIGESPGSYYINISVNDSAGLTTSQTINLTLINNTAPTFDNLTATLNATEDLEFYYNMSLNVSDAQGNTIYFYDNSSLFEINETTGIINFTGNNSQVGSYIINFTINDTYGAMNSQIVNFTIINTNDAPILVGTIPNLTWAEDTTATYNIYHVDRDCDEVENCLCDPDADPVTITYTSVSNIALSVNHSTGLITLTPDADWFGTRYIIFNVTDGVNITESNNVTLNVTEVVEQIVTVTTGGGGGGSRPKQSSLNIAPEGNLQISPNAKKISSFVIENTGEVGFPDLTLEPSSNIQSMSIDLDKTTFNLPIAGKDKVEAIITTGSIEPGTYNITFLAKSSSQRFEQRISIYLDVTGEEMTRIQFVKDMFQENPECLELNELVTRAENFLSLGRDSEATALIEKAIEGCRELILTQEQPTEETSIWQNKKLIRYGSISFAVLILVSISIGYFIREFKGSKKPQREEWKFEVS